MANLIIASPEIGDQAKLTGSTAAASLPITNLKTMPIGHVTRFLAPAGVFIQADLGSNPKPVDLIALLGHNATAFGTARVRGANSLDDLSGSPEYDSGIIRMRSNIVAPDFIDQGSLASNHFLLHLPEPKTLRYWRIDISDPTAPYLDIGRFYLSKAFQPKININYGLKQGVIDPSNINRVASARIVANKKKKRRFTEFQMSFGTEEEMFGAAYDIDQHCGITCDVLVINDFDNKPLLQKRSIYGNMTTLNPVENQYYQLFEKTYHIEEIVA